MSPDESVSVIYPLGEGLGGGTPGSCPGLCFLVSWVWSRNLFGYGLLVLGIVWWSYIGTEWRCYVDAVWHMQADTSNVFL